MSRKPESKMTTKTRNVNGRVPPGTRTVRELTQDELSRIDSFAAWDWQRCCEQHSRDVAEIRRAESEAKAVRQATKAA